MNRYDLHLRLAISSVLALTGTALAGSAWAGDEDKEQCAGVVKAGLNDCATVTNACHGHVTADGNPNAWIYLPKGTCARLVGAHVVQVKDPTPKKE
jgi:uncharacterized membrane protein